MEHFIQMSQLGSVMASGGFDANEFFAGLYYKSMFQREHRFEVRTVSLLIRKVGCDDGRVSFEQFCMIMEYIRDLKIRFARVDVDRNGCLDFNELVHTFSVTAMPV